MDVQSVTRLYSSGIGLNVTSRTSVVVVRKSHMSEQVSQSVIYLSENNVITTISSLALWAWRGCMIFPAKLPSLTTLKEYGNA